MNWISRTLVATAGLTALVSLPGAANAAVSAYAVGNVNMRTCGSTKCPRIATVPVGAPVTIYGCTGGYGWCDTQWGRYRGWVSGRYLQAVAPGYAEPSPLPAIGAMLGIAILGAAIADSSGYYYGYGYPYYRGGYAYPRYRYPGYPGSRYRVPPRGGVTPSWRGYGGSFGAPRGGRGSGPSRPLSAR